MKRPFRFCLLLTSLAPVIGYAQNISGRILDENNNPVPFANIFIRETESGTSANAKGEYFITIDPGIYHVAVSSIGYNTVQEEIIV
ncbi:MAG TPA: carboxypeptidase-like regulatory domain-containing protein, partial [Chryseosolibacter sp.]